MDAGKGSAREERKLGVRERRRIGENSVTVIRQDGGKGDDRRDSSGEVGMEWSGWVG